MVAQRVGWLLSQFIAMPEESDWVSGKKRPRPLFFCPRYVLLASILNLMFVLTFNQMCYLIR